MLAVPVVPCPGRRPAQLRRGSDRSRRRAGLPGGWSVVATYDDPDWADRHVSVVVLTDGDDTCGGDPCTQASDLYSKYGVRTFIVAFGAQPVAGSAIECAAAAGGTGAPYYPQTERNLIEDLSQIYAAAALP